MHTPSRTIRLPRVILLTFFDKLPCKELKLTRNNVFERDKNTCQYCARVLAARAVEPRSRHPA